jgi:hypothetical protein
VRIAQKRQISTMNIDSWVNAVENKLRKIGIMTVLNIRHDIMTINQKLHYVGRSMMHRITLQQMAEQSANNVNSELGAACAEVTKLQAPCGHTKRPLKLVHPT